MVVVVPAKQLVGAVGPRRREARPCTAHLYLEPTTRHYETPTIAVDEPRAAVYTFATLTCRENPNPKVEAWTLTLEPDKKTIGDIDEPPGKQTIKGTGPFTGTLELDCVPGSRRYHAHVIFAQVGGISGVFGAFMNIRMNCNEDGMWRHRTWRSGGTRPAQVLSQKMGGPRPGWAAHHIIPAFEKRKGAWRSQARGYACRVRPNEAMNGVWMRPREHQRVHNAKYFAWVYERLGAAMRGNSWRLQLPAGQEHPRLHPRQDHQRRRLSRQAMTRTQIRMLTAVALLATAAGCGGEPASQATNASALTAAVSAGDVEIAIHSDEPGCLVIETSDVSEAPDRTGGTFSDVCETSPGSRGGPSFILLRHYCNGAAALVLAAGQPCDAIKVRPDGAGVWHRPQMACAGRSGDSLGILVLPDAPVRLQGLGELAHLDPRMLECAQSATICTLELDAHGRAWSS